jgi:hypothetical protein
MKQVYFSLESGDILNWTKGYTAGDTWNGWECPIFTADNLQAVFSPTKITFQFTADGIPTACIHHADNEVDYIVSSPIWNGHEWVLGYAPQGYCFVSQNEKEG